MPLLCYVQLRLLIYVQLRLKLRLLSYVHIPSTSTKPCIPLHSYVQLRYWAMYNYVYWAMHLHRVIYVAHSSVMESKSVSISANSRYFFLCTLSMKIKHLFSVFLDAFKTSWDRIGLLWQSCHNNSFVTSEQPAFLSLVWSLPTRTYLCNTCN